MDPTLRNLATLHPVAQQYAVAVTDALREAGLPAVIVEGYRSPARQRALYAQGRTRPGPIVTHTLESTHRSRSAWDTAFLVNGRVTWDVPGEWWDYLGAVAEHFGLRWGGRWSRLRDRPHVELP